MTKQFLRIALCACAAVMCSGVLVQASAAEHLAFVHTALVLA